MPKSLTVRGKIFSERIKLKSTVNIWRWAPGERSIAIKLLILIWSRLKFRDNFFPFIINPKNTVSQKWDRKSMCWKQVCAELRLKESFVTSRHVLVSKTGCQMNLFSSWRTVLFILSNGKVKILQVSSWNEWQNEGFTIPLLVLSNNLIKILHFGFKKAFFIFRLFCFN